MAVADRLWPGCDLPGCCGLSFPRRRDCAALAAAADVSSRLRSACDAAAGVVFDDGARDDEVLGGGRGALAVEVAGVLTAGEFCVEGGSGWARGVFMAEFCEAAGE